MAIGHGITISRSVGPWDVDMMSSEKLGSDGWFESALESAPMASVKSVI